MSTVRPQLTVSWENPPELDHYALLKAVAIVFRRPLPLSTDLDLTSSDKTLSCGREQNL